MNFLIADTFTDSLARLTGDEQKAVKTTAFDLQLNPESPGLSFHKLDRARDKNFWSVRVSSDIRVIVHRAPGSLLLCYVDHHDKAYDWASRRKLETHPATGAAQLVEVRETVQEILVPAYVEPPVANPSAPKTLLFVEVPDSDLLAYGVPSEWLVDVRTATEDTLFAVADHLPAEAAEALLEIATGSRPPLPVPVAPGIGPFEHPDAQRRFRVVSDVDELARALDYPWDKWTVFLHPEQRQWVTKDQSGPARVSGSAGTGKTVVALHRAVHLARAHPEIRVLLSTFSKPLAADLKDRLFQLVRSEPRLAERIDVLSIDAVADRLYKYNIGTPSIADSEQIRGLIDNASKPAGGHKFSASFIRSEWHGVVDAWQVGSWETYRDLPRYGRRVRLPEAQRATLWQIFEQVRNGLELEGLVTRAAVFTRLAEWIQTSGKLPYEAAVVDEAQDLGVAHLRFFAALGGGRMNGIFFAGDLGQRIFQQPFSWRSLGVDVRGRSKTLRVNYRTSHQIRSQADRLLGREVADADGNVEKRGDAISVFNGPAPEIVVAMSETEERDRVAEWIRERLRDGVDAQEIAIFVRSGIEIDRAVAAVQATDIAFRVLDEQVERVDGEIAVGTMHLAKGLEFKAVVVMCCDDEIIPDQARIEAVGDEAELQEVHDTERHLLYVACTRARDCLLVSCVAPASEFLYDMRK